MVAKGSPDWLPSGWTVQYKVQKTGRKIRFYTNLETGKSFYYKDDVIGYIKSTQSQKSQPTSRGVKTQSGNSPVQLTVKTNEHPEWLPAGWKVESRTRMSGSNVGAVYKCYIDPVTDSRFYSKPEVFRYLRTVKNKLCTLKERRTSNGTNSTSRVVIEHYKDEDLPPGWIKEIKIKEKADGIRKDPFYIDPKSGYIFRSKKEVFRYLETGDISRHAFKPKEGGDEDQELISDKKSRSTVRGQKLEHSAATPQPLAGEETATRRRSERPGVHIQQLKQRQNMSSALKDALVLPVETVEEIILPQEAVIKESTEIEEKSQRNSLSPKADHTEGNETERVSSDNVEVSTCASESDQEKALPKAEKLESNKIQIVVTPDNSPLSNTASMLEHEKISISNMVESGDNGRKTKTRKSKKKKDINLPRRSSKRLAGLEPELVPKEEAKEVPQALNRNIFTEVSPDAGLTVKADADVHNTDKASQQLDVRSKKDNKDHIPNIKDTSLCEIPSNKRKTPLACGLDAPEEKIQRVETEKKDDGKMEAQLNVPIADFWSDPCLEFAIKTLTGALPVENATTTSEPVSNPTVDYLQEQSSVKNGPGSCMNKRTQGNKRIRKKKELTTNRQSPSVNGLKPELASNIISTELASNIISFEQANPNHHSNEAVLAFNLSDGRIHGQPPSKNEQYKTSCEILPPSELHHPLPQAYSERFNRINTCHESSNMVLDDPHQMLHTKNHTTSEVPLSFPFGDTWADPCLDFAFKTLTGAIPIDDSLEIQSFFEERLESSRSQKDSSPALPDFGSPNLFQNDISSHFDGPEKSVSGQHLSLDPQLTLGNVSLPSCSGFTSQQQSSVDRNRSFRGR